MTSSKDEQAAFNTAFEAKYPGFAKSQLKQPRHGDIFLGTTALGEKIYVHESVRVAHSHTIGMTRSGKTTYLEHLIKQDIGRGRGVVLIDPHGGDSRSPRSVESLYGRILTHCHEIGLVDAGIVHIIDPQRKTHVAGFNPLAAIPGYTPDTIASAMLECVEVVWEEDTHEKPATRAVLKAAFTALAELGLPLTYAPALYKVDDADGFRAHVITSISDPYAKDILEDLHEKSQRRNKSEFDRRVEGPKNRLAEFTSNATVRRIIDQTDHLVDLLSIMNKNHVLLVNLQETGTLTSDYARLLGTMLLRHLFLLAPMRTYATPFFITIDEAHRYLTPDINRLLDEAGKHGIAVNLAHQRMGQLLEAGPEILSAVTACTNVKTIFRMRDNIEATDLARRFLPRDYEKPIEILIRPAVVGHEILWLKNQSSGTQVSENESSGQADGSTVGRGRAKGEAFGTQQSTAVGEAIMHFEGVTDATSSVKTINDSLSQSLVPSTDSLFGTMMPGTIGAPIPNTMALTVGRNTGLGDANTQGRSSGTGSTSSFIQSRGTSYAQSVVLSDTESFSTVLSKVQGTSRGHSSTDGLAETLAPIYKDLAPSIHPLETVLDMMGSTILGFANGEAFVAIGYAAHRIKVPYDGDAEVTAPELDAAINAAFAASPYVTPVETVDRQSEIRRSKIFEQSRPTKVKDEPDITTPESWDDLIKDQIPIYPDPPPMPNVPTKSKPPSPPKKGKPELTIVKKSDDDDDEDPPPAAA